MKIAIVGGGVSGVITAIELSKKGHKVTIFEKNDRLLKKLLITGNGRCNFSNSSICRSNFHGNGDFLDRVFSKEIDEAKNYIINLGITPYTDERNRIFPMSLQAQSIVEILLYNVEKMNVLCLLKSQVTSISVNKKNFLIKTNNYEDNFDRIVFSAGSMSYPNMGTDGSQYKIIEKLGHKKTRLLPGIGPLIAGIEYGRELKGLKVMAEIKAGEITTIGDLLFTDNGVSGNSIFEISSYVLRNNISNMTVDFLPLIKSEELYSIIKNKVSRNENNDPKWILNGIIHKRLYRVMFKMLNIKTVSDINVSRLVNLIKNYEIKNISSGSWALSQVTIGGISTNEIKDNFESKLINGLYFTGEVLDVDGDCGGYNLTWAIFSALQVSKKLR